MQKIDSTMMARTAKTIHDVVTHGRDGLDIAVVIAVGSDRQNGGNTNANVLTANSEWRMEANPNLGWRDIQQILAISAKKVANDSTWRAIA
ncbi:MAG: hypothetical protein HZA62_02800 [Rhodocyclales bacterium]|nr:hypothetical protein [Rhodocyclales bacterium]MBI5107651.1 hypothetical protein [Rhodocyclales bacterium]